MNELIVKVAIDAVKAVATTDSKTDALDDRQHDSYRVIEFSDEFLNGCRRLGD